MPAFPRLDAVLGSPACRCIGCRRAIPKSRVAPIDEIEQFLVQIVAANRDEIDDGHRYMLLQKSRTFCDERPAMFGPILVGGTDNLDGGDQPTKVPGVVN